MTTFVVTLQFEMNALNREEAQQKVDRCAYIEKLSDDDLIIKEIEEYSKF